ncbi:MAG: polysaccharide deacetylase, partial [Klenkia sp.]|nr:polysaccharide deacetylase [Klenkia sp.]
METGTTTMLHARSSPPVFMYHSVSPSCAADPFGLRVHPDRLDQQLTTLRRLGLRPVPMRELLHGWRAGDRRLVGLTFDDGYADFVEHAMPVLEAHGVRASLYVVVGSMSCTNTWDDAPQVPLVSPDQVAAVAAAGHEIGSHSLNHVRHAGRGDAAVRADALRSREVLEEMTGSSVPGFCYPYGSFDDDAVAAVQAAGYEYAVVTDDYGNPG